MNWIENLHCRHDASNRSLTMHLQQTGYLWDDIRGYTCPPAQVTTTKMKCLTIKQPIVQCLPTLRITMHSRRKYGYICLNISVLILPCKYFLTYRLDENLISRNHAAPIHRILISTIFKRAWYKIPPSREHPSCLSPR